MIKLRIVSSVANFLRREKNSERNVFSPSRSSTKIQKSWRRPWNSKRTNCGWSQLHLNFCYFHQIQKSASIFDSTLMFWRVIVWIDPFSSSHIFSLFWEMCKLANLIRIQTKKRFPTESTFFNFSQDHWRNSSLELSQWSFYAPHPMFDHFAQVQRSASQRRPFWFLADLTKVLILLQSFSRISGLNKTSEGNFSSWKKSENRKN